MTSVSRRIALGTILGAAAAPPALVRAQAQAKGDPVLVGVSGPLTGQYAQYGADWKRGFDLAVDAVNASDGVGGHPLAYTFEDTQADPRQSVAVAQKFVSDSRIIIELGDFSSAASMAASPIYQRGRLVQFGFTNSHPDFTKGGDYMWSNAPNQADDMPVLADYAARLGLKKFGVAYINSDWGRTSKDLFVRAAQASGATVVAAEAYLPDEKDFRSLLVRLRDAKPDSLVLVSYYPDGAELMRQVRAETINLPVVAAGSVYSPKFLELGGNAVNGVYTTTNFFPGDHHPAVQRFVAGYQAKYHAMPGAYNARAYDAMIVAATLMRQYGATRDGVHDGLSEIKDIPSVVFGSITFDPATRRVKNPSQLELLVKGGAFTLWDGTPARAS
jgi:branched-chain amino acid transport system substrate-binding protein